VIPDGDATLRAAVAPFPAVTGTVALGELVGLRRLYAALRYERALLPFYDRLGPATRTVGPELYRWDLRGMHHVNLDLLASLLDRVTARREGGRFAGPCPRSGSVLRCNSADGWNHPQVTEQILDGVAHRCVFAHPQDQSRLIFEVANVPPSQFVLGAVGIDDRVILPGAAAVDSLWEFQPDQRDRPALVQHIVAPNRVGATPYRMALGNVAGSLRITVTASNAGARHFCFTAAFTSSP